MEGELHIVGAMYGPFLLGAVLLFVFYILALHRLITKIRPGFRLIESSALWPLFVPVINIFWHLYVVVAISRSVRAEFRERKVRPAQEINDVLFGVAAFTMNLILLASIGFAFLATASLQHTWGGLLGVVTIICCVLTPFAVLGHWWEISVMNACLCKSR